MGCADNEFFGEKIGFSGSLNILPRINFCVGLIV